MTNEAIVLSFVQNNPGRTQQEISNALGITPEQQINQILHKLMQKSLVYRDKQEGPYKYYPVSASVQATTESFPWECAYIKYMRSQVSIFPHDRCLYPGCGRDKIGWHTLEGKQGDYKPCPVCGGNGVKEGGPGILDMDLYTPCSCCKGLGLVHK